MANLIVPRYDHLPDLKNLPNFSFKEVGVVKQLSPSHLLHSCGAGNYGFIVKVQIRPLDVITLPPGERPRLIRTLVPPSCATCGRRASRLLGSFLEMVMLEKLENGAGLETPTEFFQRGLAKGIKRLMSDREERHVQGHDALELLTFLVLKNE